MKRGRLVLVVVAAWMAPAVFMYPARATGTDPTASDPLGPLVDVTSNWQAYQPSDDFCVHPTVFEFPSTSDTSSGLSPACAASGFGAADTGLYEVKITTPTLCQGCRRLFIDYSKIGLGTPTAPVANGHAYFRLMTFNQGYKVPPDSHSPNVKNLTNDYLVSPPGTPISTAAAAIDQYDWAYTGDTANFGHIAVQGPYYVGPWYLNTAGHRVDGAYLDVDLSGATELPQADLNVIRYAAGFDSSPSTCADAELFGAGFTDGNYFYGGCVNAFGGSSPPGVDPWVGT